MVNKLAAPPESAATRDIHVAITALQRLADAFSVRRERLAGAVGLSEHQWAVLEEIATFHFMPSMFARRRRSSAAAISKTLRQLLDKGLVLTMVAKDDGRQRTYVLTEKGKRTMSRLRARRQQAIDRIWSDLEPRDLRAFSDFSGALTARLERYAEPGKQEER